MAINQLVNIMPTKSSYTTSNGKVLQTYHWPATSLRTTLLIVHGYAEHAGRYNSLAKDLNARGIEVFAYDQRGYGHSEGMRAYVDSFQEYVSDLGEIVDQLPERRIFLMGHSMGGLVSSLYCSDRPSSKIGGLISSSGLLALHPDLSPILQKIAPILGAILPKLPTEKLDKTYLTRNETARAEYMNDPLVYLGGTRARVGAEILRYLKIIQERSHQITLPLLVQHGSADRLTLPEGTKHLYEKASSSDKTLKIYEGLYHELIHEPERDEVIDFVAAWIESRT